MKDIIVWAVGDPWHYAFVLSIFAFILGVMIGYSAKTNKYERAQHIAEQKLRAVLATIELKKVSSEP